MEPISIAVRTFNERVRTMNQTGGKQVVLSAAEARNLHNDIYSLLANLAELTSQPDLIPPDQIVMDGGGFK